MALDSGSTPASAGAGNGNGSGGFLSGKTFGSYRVGELLEGAHSVYAAEPTAGGDKVALRVFSIDLSRDKNLAPRLVADLQKSCAVQHPALPAVRDIGTADFKGKKYLYIATERLTGESLKRRLARANGAPLPLTQALHIASEVGAALQAIHRGGGTHRHLNASAVLLAPPKSGDRDERVYLLDLGTALVPTDGGQGKSPKGGKISDDVRGLAGLVQEMLGGGTATAAGAPVLPLRLRNRQVPARVDAVLRSALGDSLSAGAADKAGRYESVAAFMAALLGTGDAQPSYAAWSEDGRTPAPARPAASPNLIWAAVLAIAIGAGIGYWFYSQESPPAPAAVADLASPSVAPPPAPPLPTSSPPSPPAPQPAVLLAVPGARPDGGADAGSPARRPGPGSWPTRTGKIPPLRDADPAPPTSASTPAAPGSTPAARVPAAAPAGGTATGAPSAPAAPGNVPAAKPPAPPQASGPGPNKGPGAGGPKEVK